MILLASGSPRRRALLQQLGVDFEVLDVDVDEARRDGESPEALVRRLAMAKAAAGRASLGAGDPRPVLGADTIVSLGDDVLGKPGSAGDAADMLMRLSGRCHRVLSAVAIDFANATACRVNESRVCFRQLARRECEAYAAGGEPLDKAGGYAIQGRAAAFVSDLHGSYSGVMGLPLFETAELLNDAGVVLFQGEDRGQYT